jgi:hypothetical protein
MNKPNITGGHVIDGVATDQYCTTAGGTWGATRSWGSTMPITDPLTFKLSRPLIEPSVIEEAKVILDVLKNAALLQERLDRHPELELAISSSGDLPYMRLSGGDSKYPDLRLVVMDQLINALKERLTEIGVAHP